MSGMSAAQESAYWGDPCEDCGVDADLDDGLCRDCMEARREANASFDWPTYREKCNADLARSVAAYPAAQREQVLAVMTEPMRQRVLAIVGKRVNSAEAV